MRTLYHVTKRENVEAIMREGLRPCARRPRVIWLIDRRHLAWAIAHVAAHQGVSIHSLTAIKVQLTPRDYGPLRKAGGKPGGKWLYLSRIHPELLSLHELDTVSIVRRLQSQIL